MAVALLLAPAGTASGRGLQLQVDGDAEATPCGHAALDTLRHGIPAARALPLLQALAAPGAAQVVVQGLDGQALRVQVSAA
jgi:hypothetical protein